MGDGPTMVGVGRSEWAWVRTGREEFGEAKSNGRASGYWRVACQEDGREDGRARRRPFVRVEWGTVGVCGVSHAYRGRQRELRERERGGGERLCATSGSVLLGRWIGRLDWNAMRFLGGEF